MVCTIIIKLCEMATRECPTSEKIVDLLYVKYDGKYRGWRVQLLVEELMGKVEGTFLLCNLCGGLLRDAFMVIIGGEQELWCSLCIPSDASRNSARMDLNRDAVEKKIVCCLKYIRFRLIRICWFQAACPKSGWKLNCFFLSVPAFG